MGKLKQYIRDNYSFDVWAIWLIDGIIDYFSESADGINTICDLLESVNIPRNEIIDNMEAADND
jgi:hypothetical protein